jgi:hypothetical protein
LLNLTVLVAFLAWIYTLDGGKFVLLGIFAVTMSFCGMVTFIYALVWGFSYFLGTPGERQRKNGRME